MSEYFSKTAGMLRRGVLIAATALMPLVGSGCYTTIGSSRADVPIEQRVESKSFTGYAVSVDNDNNKDLDFMLESYDYESGKTFDVSVHETWDASNLQNLNDVRAWVEESFNGKNELQVIGKYTSIEDDQNLERGIMNPYAVVKVNENASGKNEEVIWTEGKSSQIYQDDPVYYEFVMDNLYPPGHFIGSVRYPLGMNPYWDSDGDGIPNRFDPDPYHFGPWVDLNRNGVWDWYDPSYSSGFWMFWGDHYHHPHSENVWREYYDSKPLDDHEFFHHKDHAVRNFGSTRGLGDYRSDANDHHRYNGSHDSNNSGKPTTPSNRGGDVMPGVRRGAGSGGSLEDRVKTPVPRDGRSGGRDDSKSRPPRRDEPKKDVPKPGDGKRDGVRGSGRDGNNGSNRDAGVIYPPNDDNDRGVIHQPSNPNSDSHILVRPDYGRGNSGSGRRSYNPGEVRVPERVYIPRDPPRITMPQIPRDNGGQRNSPVPQQRLPEHRNQQTTPSGRGHVRPE